MGPSSLRRPDPSLATTLPLGGDTASLSKTYAKALSAVEAGGADALRRAALDKERALSLREATAASLVGELSRMNSSAGAEIASLGTVVASLTSQLHRAQGRAALAEAAALAAPLGIRLGATAGVFAGVGVGAGGALPRTGTPSSSSSASAAAAAAAASAPRPGTRRSPSPPLLAAQALAAYHGSSSSPGGSAATPPLAPPDYAPKNFYATNTSVAGVLGMPDPLANAPSPWPAGHPAAKLLASPVRWKPARAKAYPSGAGAAGAGAGSPAAGAGGSPRAASPPKGYMTYVPPHKAQGSLADMLAAVSTGRSERLGQPVAVSVARTARAAGGGAGVSDSAGAGAAGQALGEPGPAMEAAIANDSLVEMET